MGGAVNVRSTCRVIVFAALFAAFGRPMNAECGRLWTDLADAKKAFTLVFSGTVVQMRPDPDGLFVTFDVRDVWKGDPTRRVTLPLYMDLDAFHLAERGHYLIFAEPLPPNATRVPTESAPVFYISQCSPSRSLSSADEVVKGLGKRRSPRRRWSTDASGVAIRKTTLRPSPIHG